MLLIHALPLRATDYVRIQRWTAKPLSAKLCQLKAVHQGHRTLFTSALSLIATLTKAYADNRLEDRLKLYTVRKLLIIDEMGYIPNGQKSQLARHP
jgi:DNA replication protein DnaC